MHIKAIIFDMDGTIVDTERIWRSATESLIASYITATMSPVRRDELFERIHGMAMREVCTLVQEYAQIDLSIDDLVREKKRIASDLYRASGVQFIDGFPHFHAKVRSASLKSGIATNADEATLAITNELLNLEQFFGPHMYSIASVANKGKPDPAIYLHTADRLEVHPHECVAIEDSAHGIAAAKAAGMRCIGINTSRNPAQLKDADGIIEQYINIDVRHLLGS